jgi:two-component system, sensor histidine kinase and response regulator
MSMSKIFDIDAALDRVDGDRSLLCELAGIYLDEAQRLEKAICCAMEQQDIVAANKAAHTLKGACANFCCPAMYDAAWALEQLRSSNTAEEIASAYTRLMQESEKLKQAIRKEFAI